MIANQLLIGIPVQHAYNEVSVINCVRVTNTLLLLCPDQWFHAERRGWVSTGTSAQHHTRVAFFVGLSDNVGPIKDHTHTGRPTGHRVSCDHWRSVVTTGPLNVDHMHHGTQPKKPTHFWPINDIRAIKSCIKDHTRVTSDHYNFD